MKTKLIITTVTALLIAPAVGFSQQYAAPAPAVSGAVEVGVLPPAVQASIQQHSGGRDIVKISAGTFYGMAGYRVQFREKGRNPDLFVAENGAVIRPQEKPPALFVGTTFDKLPAAVQNAITRQIGNGEILKIDREGKHSGPRYYKVDVMDSNGLAYKLQVSEDGRILEDSRAQR